MWLPHHGAELGLAATDNAPPLTRAEFLRGQAFALRANGLIAFGDTGRYVRMLADAGPYDLAATLIVRLDAARLDAARDRLDAALADPPADRPSRRPSRRCCRRAARPPPDSAYRAGRVTVAMFGTTAHHAQRLARDGIFALVAATRPQSRADRRAGPTAEQGRPQSRADRRAGPTAEQGRPQSRAQIKTELVELPATRPAVAPPGSRPDPA